MVDYYLKGMQTQLENNPNNKALQQKILEYMKKMPLKKAKVPTKKKKTLKIG